MGEDIFPSVTLPERSQYQAMLSSEGITHYDIISSHPRFLVELAHHIW